MNDDLAGASPVDQPIGPPLRMTPGIGGGYYLLVTDGSGKQLERQPEPLWHRKLKNAEAGAVAISERTGFAVLVVKVVGQVVPWHQR